MAKPPIGRVREEARIWFNKDLDECTDEERDLCEDMAWEYCGMSPMEAAEEEFYQKNGYDLEDVADDGEDDDEWDEEED